MKLQEKGVGDDIITGLDNVKNSLDSTASEMPEKGKAIADGLRNGVDSNVKEIEYTSIWGRIGDWFKRLFDIHSPSTVFFGYGGNIGQGLLNGVNNSVKQSNYTSIFDRIKKAWQQLKSWWSKLSLPALKFKTPHFVWTSQPASGWIAKSLAAIGLPT